MLLLFEDTTIIYKGNILFKSSNFVKECVFRKYINFPIKRKNLTTHAKSKLAM